MARGRIHVDMSNCGLWLIEFDFAYGQIFPKHIYLGKQHRTKLYIGKKLPRQVYWHVFLFNELFSSISKYEVTNDCQMIHWQLQISDNKKAICWLLTWQRDIFRLTSYFKTLNIKYICREKRQKKSECSPWCNKKQ